MRSMCEQLQKFHNLDVVFFILSSENIYISEGNHIFFSDWSMVKNRKEIQDKKILRLFNYLPEFVLGNGEAT